jgi:hypothetical protein
MSSIGRGGGVKFMEAELAEIAERVWLVMDKGSHRTGCAIIAGAAAIASAQFAASERGAKYALPTLALSAAFAGWFAAAGLSGSNQDL